MLDKFLIEFKRLTELRWKNRTVDPTAYGFQIQPGTQWLPGLLEQDIAEYESLLEISFPHDLRTFLKSMNGTDLPALNVYGSCGEPLRELYGIYSYPRDFELVQQKIADVRTNRIEIVAELAEQGFNLSAEAKLAPIFFHRYVACEPDLNNSVVLSIYGSDAIVYASSLQEYLTKEFL